MKKKYENNEMFQAAHLIILLTYSIFSIILIGESLLMDWEKWPIVAIAGGIVLGWTLHIRHSLSNRSRIWVYSGLTMYTFFYYGSHVTSVFDTVAVMSVVIILYTMTGMKNLITFLQIIYYITFAYGFGLLIHSGTEIDGLIITRSLLHIAVITTVSCISRIIIVKWISVLNHSKRDIETLKDTTERLNDFLANVSHEIRTPVNAVIGLTGICIDEEKDEKKLVNLNAVRDAGRRVADQIGDILDYSEIDRKKLTNNFEDYMFSSVLNDIVAEIKPYRRDDIELIIDVDPSIPAVLHSDVSKLRKILKHLIMNGLKYTREGGVYVRISMEKETYGVNLLIEVTDTGIGMTEEEVDRIFDRFYQADSGRARQGGGLGIGMPIVYGFVSSLGGFLIINSKPDVGTTVRVSIPQKVADPESCMSVFNRDALCLGAYLHFEKFEHPMVREYYNDMVMNIVNGLGVQMHRVDNFKTLKKLLETVRLTHLFIGEEEYNEAKDFLEPYTSRMVIVVIAGSDFRLPSDSKVRIMEKPFYCFPVVTLLNSNPNVSDIEEAAMYCRGVRALVVDDEPMNITVARNIFNRYGMTVTAASSGMEAIDLCRERDFDIVFMDHMMPGMDGVEAMKRINTIRAKQRNYIPMVALTANAVSTAKEMFLAEGFDGFVSKPIELVELERVMKRVLPSSLVTYERPGEEESFSVNTKKADDDFIETFEPVGDSSDKNIEKMDIDEFKNAFEEKLTAIGIDCAQGLEYSMNECGLYKTVLCEYAHDSEEKLKNLDRFFKDKDLKNYKIAVHALKSTSKMIGNGILSDDAKSLENAAKEGDSFYIIKNHKRVMDDYVRLAEGIKKIFDV